MAKTQKPRRPKAETPKGFRDYFGEDVTRRKAMLDTIAGVYHRYGFDPLETSAVETVEALGSFLPDVDRPNEGVFAWDEGEEGRPDWLALRYDLTAPLARFYAQHRNDLPIPYRRYAMGPVWRNEKPGPGRFRQFYQCDADTVGAASVAADAEICAMLCDVLEAVGLRGQYVVRVNNRKVLNGVLEVAGLLDPADPSTFEAERGIVLRAIDKLDRLGVEGVRALLGKGRRDESGDFTEGAGLDVAAATTVLAFLDRRDFALDEMDRLGGFVMPASSQDPGAFDGPDREFKVATYKLRAAGEDAGADEAAFRANLKTLAKLYDLVKVNETGRAGVMELVEIATLLTRARFGPDRIVIDPSTVRGLGYYTGPVFEAELTFPITDEDGATRNFGSVAGGGRYDDLVTRFTGQSVPATGVSIGVDRLLAALDAKGRTVDAAPGPVVVTVMDRDRMADYQSICAALRAEGIGAEVYLGNPKTFGNQLKYADQRHSPAAIIQGSDEAARGVVQVKDLILGAKLAQDATVEEWKENPSQTEISVRDADGKLSYDGLVAHLRGMDQSRSQREELGQRRADVPDEDWQ